MRDLEKKLNIKSLSFKKDAVNKCRKAVLTQNQFKLKRTEENYDGMYAVSDVGKVRMYQQDGYLILTHPFNKKFKIMVVADGMGGCMSGELASNEALKETIIWFEQLNPELYYGTEEILKELWLKNLISINQKIGRHFDDRGTTYLGIIILNSSILGCNIGDSRAFIFFEKEKKKSYFSTDDQSYSYQLYKVGDIEYVDDIRFHAYSHILENFLGVGGLRQEPDFFLFKNTDLYDSLKLVLCSDGVTDCLSIKQILDIIDSYDIKDIPKELVDRALSNVSLVREELLRNYCYNNRIIAGKDNATCVAYSLKKKRLGFK